MRLVNAELAPIYLNSAACEQIKQMPTVDAIPVVRCRECKYAMFYGYYECGVGHLGIVKPDDFCSCGEKDD